MDRKYRISWSALVGLILLVTLLTFAPGPAFAKLSAGQVDSLRAVGASQGWTFQLNQNPATQYDLEQLTGMKEPANWRQGAKFDDMSGPRRGSASASVNVPASFDWRAQISGGLPPIRNQGGCGSCWAFATVGAFECAIKIKDGNNVDLSEQYLVNCNHNGYGCAGGWWCHDMHTNVADNCGGVGAVLEVNDPYMAADGACTCPFQHDYKLDSWSYIGAQWSTPTDAQIKQAVMTYGPVSVAIYAGPAFQAYGGGIFNACEAGQINHAVVIVGWNDSSNVWIIRNSWGPYWGEGGYMRIHYGCNSIGYNATYVNYSGRVAIMADSTLGPTPLGVNFSVQTALPMQSCSWNFGDNTTSNMMTPTHVYPSPGTYNVSVSMQSTDGMHNTTDYNLIGVYADTVIGASVTGGAGKSVEVDLYARNYLPITEIDLPLTWAGTAGLNLDSVSTTGLRTAYLGVSQWLNLDPTFLMRGVYSLATTPNQTALAPGSGPILRLYFTVSSTPTGPSNPISLSSFVNGTTNYAVTFKSTSGAYTPAFTPGQIKLCSAGDVNGDGHGPDLADLSALVSYLTGSYQPPVLQNANVNGIGVVDLGDLSYMVAFLTGAGPAPVCK